MAALVILVTEVILLLVLPPLLKLDPYSIDAIFFNAPPSAAHWLGTDDTGRDLFARVIFGGRVSLLVGVGSTLISVLIGLPLGLLAGFYKGKTAAVIMRLTDVFMSIPAIILILVIVAVFEPSISSIILVIGLTGWTEITRLINSTVISVREKDYVEAAIASGEKKSTVMLRYVLPNAIAPLWVSVAFRISSAMLTESGLSFLGAGVQPPQASWGNIINSAKSIVVLSQRPWIWIPPGVLLMLTVVCVNLVGEGIRDALDPKMKRGIRWKRGKRSLRSGT